MTRPIWKGYITFGLVNIPVILYPAEKKFDIQFKLIDSRDKAKIRYMRVNEHTGEEVPWSNIAKGYEFEDHNYVVLKDADIKAISGEHYKTIDIASFIDKNSLDYMDYEKPYYLVPDKKGEKGYVILRETLKATKKIGICKVIIHTREYLAALIPYEHALILNLLRYHQELRKTSEFELPSDSLKTYKISAKEMDISKQLVASMTTKWDPNSYHDNFRKALQRWIEDKIQYERKGKKLPLSKQKTPVQKSNVINFVDLLKKSLEKNKSSKTHGLKKPRAK
jgi:DNA end-binding protein Ku